METTQTFSVKSLLDMADGAIKERLAYEVPRIFDNILDPNTDPDKEREMTLKLKFKPSENRTRAKVKAFASSKLQPTDPVEFTLVLSGLGRNITVYEAPQHTPGQLSMNGTETPAPAILEMIREV